MVPKARLRGARAQPLDVVERASAAWCRRSTDRGPGRSCARTVVLEPLGLQLLAERRRAAVLPDDGAVHRVARCLRSHSTVVSRWLVMPMAATSLGFRRAARSAALRSRFRRDAPDLLGIVLHPARPRIVLAELRVAAAAHPALSRRRPSRWCRWCPDRWPAHVTPYPRSSPSARTIVGWALKFNRARRLAGMSISSRDSPSIRPLKKKGPTRGERARSVSVMPAISKRASRRRGWIPA